MGGRGSSGGGRAGGASSAVLNAIAALSPSAGTQVKLSDLRQRLGQAGVSRESTDRALRGLAEEGKVVLHSWEGGGRRSPITEADRAAAIRFGGQDKHRVVLVPGARP